MTETRDLKAAYRSILAEHFPARLELRFGEGNQAQSIVYEKVQWTIDGERQGLRYGENPGQEAALFKPVNGNLVLGSVQCIQPGRWLASDPELLQSGKHPGKINITDADNALNILRYLNASPCAVIVKHNNPCGVAQADSLADAFHRALKADRLAAFGGCIALNRECDRETAEQIVAQYAEVVVAPAFAAGVMAIFSRKKNLRVMRIGNMQQLCHYAPERFVDIKSLIDGGLVLQWSFVPSIQDTAGFQVAETTHQGKTVRIARQPTMAERNDLLFGWLVEAGVTSNSVLFVKDGATVGIGAGEQDRVGVAEIARDKAYRKRADWLCWERHGQPYNTLSDDRAKAAIDAEVAACRGGLTGAVMVSDAFFPFRDGIDVGLREGVSAVVQPGGSLRDYEVIEACNEVGATMVFTGQRSFKH